jgi:putative nucleotidyltransferase with HDIG domain
VRIGDFILEERIGAGAMGEVYRARQVSLDRPVAVKLLSRQLAQDATARQRFAREARAAACLVHPNVIQIHAVGAESETPFLAMELVPGPDLEAVLQKEGRLSVARALAVTRGVASALACAAEHGVVHRDLKPANLKVDANGLVKVMDFGLALVKGTRISTTETLQGSPSYVSPEQCRGEPPDGRSDLYSLGVVLYRMLTGVLPVRATSLAGLLERHAFFDPEPPRSIDPAIPASVDALCLSLLRKDPAKRLQTARALLAALDELGLDGLADAGLFTRLVAYLRGPRSRAHAGALARPGPARLAKSDGARSTARRGRTPPPVWTDSSRIGRVATLETELEDEGRLALLRGLTPDGPIPPLSWESAAVEARVEEQLRTGTIELPLLPRTTFDVLAVLNDPRAQLEQVARLVLSDPVLAAELIARANAVDVAGRTPVTDPTLAIARIGIRRLRAKLFTVAARAIVLKGAVAGGLARQLWSHSVGCAVLAREVASLVGEDTETAFVGGLLHDVGALVVLESAARAARALGVAPPEAEDLRVMVAHHHEAAGARVAAVWKLPPEIAPALGSHHRVPDSPARLSAIVALADRLCRVGPGAADPSLAPFVEAARLPEGGLAKIARRMPALLDEVQQRLNT